MFCGIYTREWIVYASREPRTGRVLPNALPRIAYTLLTRQNSSWALMGVWGYAKWGEVWGKPLALGPVYGAMGALKQSYWAACLMFFPLRDTASRQLHGQNRSIGHADLAIPLWGANHSMSSASLTPRSGDPFPTTWKSRYLDSRNFEPFFSNLPCDLLAGKRPADLQPSLFH